MSPPSWPGPPARSRRPRGRAIRSATTALGAVLALAAGLLSQAGSAQAATPWPAGRGAQVREQVWIAAPLSGTLGPGMAGTAVRTLQQRLAQLHYYPGPVNGRFGTDTLEAVWAFKEVQGLPITSGADDVDPAMQQALARPRLPQVLVPGGGGTRIEVNLPAEVLVLYAHHQVQLITHISAGGGYYYRCPGGGTCGPALTPDGNYRARLFVAGWLRVALGRMYNPVFFIGTNFAIHGDVPIPLRPASHGCVRVPVDVANVLYQQVRIGPGGGTPIYIRGRAPGTVVPATRPGRSSAPATPAPRVTGIPAPVSVPGVGGLLPPRAASLLSPRAADLLSPR
jgi:peptidoglycan hydrolase-like protein with peptidoglycan-binding domain